MASSLNERRKATAQILARLAGLLEATHDTDLAKVLRENVTTIYGWRRRGTIPIQLLYDISEELGVSLEWLLKGRGPKLSRHLNNIHPRSQIPQTVGYIRIPVNEVQTRSGAFSDVNYNFALFKETWLQSLTEKLDALRLFIVEDAAMMPRYLPGDILIIDHRMTEPERDGFYAVLFDKATVPTIRWVNRTSDNKISVVAMDALVGRHDYNPNEQPFCRFLGLVLCVVAQKYFPLQYIYGAMKDSDKASG